MKRAFTILELIFVIVIIGILAGVAIPRLFTGVDEANIAKAKTQVANIRAGISSLYSKNIMAGNMDKCPELEKSTSDDQLFENIIYPPIKKDSGDIKWHYEGNSSDETNYTLSVGDMSVRFVYDKNVSKNCPFECNDSNSPLCK
jgi:general secretion pathway protein G